MDADLASRLDGIERRQRFILLLLVYPYLVGVVWAMTGAIDETAALQATAIAILLVIGWYVRAAVRARSSTEA